jgi:hypothetical protein
MFCDCFLAFVLGAAKAGFARDGQGLEARWQGLDLRVGPGPGEGLEAVNLSEAEQVRKFGEQVRKLDTKARKLDTKARKLDTKARKLDTKARKLDTKARKLDTNA